MSRLPLRLRLTLAFAVAMAVVLADPRRLHLPAVRATLDEQIDQGLATRAAVLRGWPRAPRSATRRASSRCSGGGTRPAQPRGARTSAARVVPRRAGTGSRSRGADAPVRHRGERHGRRRRHLDRRPGRGAVRAATQLEIGGRARPVLRPPVATWRGRRWDRSRRCGGARRRSRPASTATVCPARGR